MSLVLLALLAALAGSSGFAQTACPQGVPPRGPRCGPSPSWHQGQKTPEESAAPRVIVRERFQVWEDRFGAIARDPEGPAGMSEWQRSEEDARIAAVADCISKGGDPNGCRNIMFEYASGCAVVALGASNSQVGRIRRTMRIVWFADVRSAQGRHAALFTPDVAAPLMLVFVRRAFARLTRAVARRSANASRRA